MQRYCLRLAPLNQLPPRGGLVLYFCNLSLIEHRGVIVVQPRARL